MWYKGRGDNLPRLCNPLVDAVPPVGSCVGPRAGTKTVIKNRIIRVGNRTHVGEITCSHSREYEDECLLACCAMFSGRNLQTF
jgi:hypothetical protein